MDTHEKKQVWETPEIVDLDVKGTEGKPYSYENELNPLVGPPS
ncbi:MAG: hypothetical protein PHS30_05340 [Bacteroidales bacterium]|nr:hypothetical protein [Bacteroidales bacterium]